MPTRPSRLPWLLAVAGALLALSAAVPAAAGARSVPCERLVTSTADSGPGSLRGALAAAGASSGPCTVRFDSVHGPFAEPQTITLQGELPPLGGTLVLDGTIAERLWVATGVTLSGGGRLRVLRVLPGARVTLKSLTIAQGRSGRGGGILNAGALAVVGVTFVGNVAAGDGGAIATTGGTLKVVNSTFAGNRAGRRGGGVAHLGGEAAVGNCTFSGNRAASGGALFTRGGLLLRNTILTGSAAGRDCVASRPIDPRSTHNLIIANGGCGTPLLTADPRLEKLGAYNGPTAVFPLGGGSPAINMGDNAAAVDEEGHRLVWDQRGNGDPRFVAGFTDIGAFEVQAFPVLTVNSPEDTGLRACTGAGASDCSLRGAIELATASGKPQVIRFDPRVFSRSPVVTVGRPLPAAAAEITLDGSGTPGIVVRFLAAALPRPGGLHFTLRRVTFAAGE